MLRRPDLLLQGPPFLAVQRPAHAHLQPNPQGGRVVRMPRGEALLRGRAEQRGCRHRLSPRHLVGRPRLPPSDGPCRPILIGAVVYVDRRAFPCKGITWLCFFDRCVVLSICFFLHRPLSIVHLGNWHSKNDGACKLFESL